MNRHKAAEWSAIGQFIVAAGTLLTAGGRRIFHAAWWQSLSTMDAWLLGVDCALLLNAAFLVQSLWRGRRSDLRIASDKAKKLAEDLAKPEQNIVVDLYNAALTVRTASEGTLVLTFRYNGWRYPATLLYHGFSVTGIEFEGHRLPQQNAADDVVQALRAVHDVRVEVSLGPSQVDTIFQALVWDYPDEPKNLRTAHQLRVTGALNLTEESGRARPVRVDRIIDNASLRITPIASDALNVLRARERHLS